MSLRWSLADSKAITINIALLTELYPIKIRELSMPGALLTELYPVKIRELSMPGERRSRRAMFIVAAACDAVSSVRSGM